MRRAIDCTYHRVFMYFKRRYDENKVHALNNTIKCRGKSRILKHVVNFLKKCIYIYIYIYTHTQIFVCVWVCTYTCVYMCVSGDSSLFLLLMPPLCQLQFPTRGPWTQSKSSLLLLRDSPLYSTDWQTYGVFFCKQSRYYIICSLVNAVDKIIFFLSKV